MEMAEEMGEENIFIFGLKVDEVQALKAKGYNAWSYVEKNPELRTVLEQLRDGYFNPENRHEFQDLYNTLVGNDIYLTLADYDDYIAKQDMVSNTYKVREKFPSRAPS